MQRLRWVQPSRRCRRAAACSFQHARYAAGFSLIEVLVAVLVIAVGLLGVASLQGNALRANRAGYERSQAAILADDMAERMRLNAQAARAGAYDHSLSDETKSSAPAPVDQDIADWNDRVEASLPGGRGAVSTGGACPNCVTVTIEIKRRDTGATETMQFETRL